MSKKTDFFKIMSYFVYAIVIVFAFLAISAKFSLGGIRLLVVQSGSMEPTIKTGSLVITKAKDAYQIGDIITFRSSQNSQETTTHRIVDEKYQISGKVFITQGDANDSPDSGQLTSERILGKTITDIPYFGYLVSFTRTLPGLIILIIIPATIIIYDEILKIKKEIILKRKEKEAKNEKPA